MGSQAQRVAYHRESAPFRATLSSDKVDPDVPTLWRMTSGARSVGTMDHSASSNVRTYNSYVTIPRMPASGACAPLVVSVMSPRY